MIDGFEHREGTAWEARLLTCKVVRVLTRFVLKYTLTAQPEPSGAHEL